MQKYAIMNTVLCYHSIYSLFKPYLVEQVRLFTFHVLLKSPQTAGGLAAPAGVSKTLPADIAAVDALPAFRRLHV